MRPTVSKFLTLLWIVTASIVLLEIVAQLLVPLLPVEQYDDLTAYYANDPNYRLLNWTDRYKAHPYFGYAPARFAEYERARSRVEPRPYRIAILGGSVAQSFGEYIRRTAFAEELRRRIPDLAAREVEVWNLAAGGYRQPQQYFVASYFLDDVDLLINVDGLNDFGGIDFYPMFPMEFHSLILKFHDPGLTGIVYRWTANVLHLFYKTLTRAPAYLPILGESRAWFLVWYAAHDALHSAIAALQNRYTETLMKSAQAESMAQLTPEEHGQGRAAIWKRYLKLQAHISQLQGKRYFFFLQPNQYLKGSKPFSEDEKRVAINPLKAEENHERIMRAKQAASELTQAGTVVHDLTAIFSHSTESVYRDQCCHLNRAGNEVMARVISDIVTENWRSSGKSTAPRETDGSGA